MDKAAVKLAVTIPKNHPTLSMNKIQKKSAEQNQQSTYIREMYISFILTLAGLDPPSIGSPIQLSS
jgi:hypothetical protein